MIGLMNLINKPKEQCEEDDNAFDISNTLLSNMNIATSAA